MMKYVTIICITLGCFLATVHAVDLCPEDQQLLAYAQTLPMYYGASAQKIADIIEMYKEALPVRYRMAISPSASNDDMDMFLKTAKREYECCNCLMNCCLGTFGTLTAILIGIAITFAS